MRIVSAKILFVVLIIFLLAVGIYFMPPVHSRLAWRVDSLRMKIYSYFNPPYETVFQPTEQGMLETIVTQTMRPPTLRPRATFIPKVTSTPLPDIIQLNGVKYEDQYGRYNYCGPANFSMALTFWGWDGNRDVIGKAVMPGNSDQEGKPVNKDKNVEPYEFKDYIADNVPGLTSTIRYGGDIDLLKRMISAGFPVVAEKGVYELDMNSKMTWMGHYAFVTGYDETKQEIIYQDTYQRLPALPGQNRRIGYDSFLKGWRAFNYVFVVVYPYDREMQVLSLLGEWADNNWAIQHALDVAKAEGKSLSGVDQYFAWFNQGTSHIALSNYVDAATAYDHASNLNNNLTGDESLRPYRMLWYQTGPYEAYFHTNRFLDVINLATMTLKTPLDGRVLEESLYWRGRAEHMIGDTNAAIEDFRAALKIHPNWEPAIQALQDLGVQP